MRQNPWKGLASYREDDALSGHSHKFCGRKNATRDLTALVKSNLFVTLYGRTGIGKTSLLEAGVFPELRSEGYIPVTIRLGTMGQQGCNAAHITQALEATIRDIRPTCQNTLQPDNKDYLWSYFATRHFYVDGKEVFPVIVLDQFEENFIRDRKATWTLLEQLYSLTDDNKIYPENYHNETVFRIIISIREDALFHLEDCIDKLGLDDLKFNRYRLVRLTEEEACEIITVPGEGILPEKPADRNAVVAEIIRMVRAGSEDGINTLILSLVCSILFEKMLQRGDSHIRLSDVKSLGNNPLKDFYLSIAHRLGKARHFIEDKLVDPYGRRNAINVEEMDSNCPDWKNFTWGASRILQTSNNKVELVHDMLAKAIYDVRLQRTRKLKGRLLQGGILIFLAILCICAVFSTVFDLGGNGSSRLQIFSRSGVVTDSAYYHNNHTRKLVWNGSGSLEVTECASLQHLVIVNPVTHLSIEDCPALHTIEFRCSSAQSVSLSNCPSINTLNIPEFVGEISTHGSSFVNTVVPKDTSRYCWLDGVLWDKFRRKIIHVSNRKDLSEGAYFPYCMRDSRQVVYTLKDTVRNRGVWKDRLLFSEDGSHIVASHNPVGPVLDLNRYPNLNIISNKALTRGNGIRTLILKDGLSIFTAEAFHECDELDTIVLRGNIVPETGYSRKVTYIAQEGGRYVNDGGVVRSTDGRALWLSAEYTDPYYSEGTEEAPGGMTVLVPGFGCTVSDYMGRKVVSQHGRMVSLAAARVVTSLTSAFKTDTYRGNHFFHTTGSNSSYATLLSPVKEKVHIPASISILDCPNLQEETHSIIIENPDFDKFLNLPVEVRRRITLYVPYGHADIFLSRPEFDDFRAIEESGLMLTLHNNLVFLAHQAHNTVTERPYRSLILTAVILAVGLLFFTLSRTKYAGKYNSRRHLILKSLFTGILMTLITVISWLVAYYIFSLISHHSHWLSLLGAGVFSAIVLFSLHKSILMEFRRIQWNQKPGIRRLSRLSSTQKRRLITGLGILAVTVSGLLLGLTFSSGNQERKIYREARALSSGKNLEGHRMALAMVCEYLDRTEQSQDNSGESHSRRQLYALMRELATAMNHDCYRGLPARDIPDCTLAYTRDSTMHVTLSSDGQATLFSNYTGKEGLPISFNKTINQLDISSHGDIVVAACGNVLSSYEIVLYNTHNRTAMAIYSSEAINGICISPDDRYIATGCADGAIRIWDLSTSPVTCTRKIDTHVHAEIEAVYYSADGTLLYACFDDHTMNIYSTDPTPSDHFLLKASLHNL